MTTGRLSRRSEFTPVPSHGSTFVYMISSQNVMPCIGVRAGGTRGAAAPPNFGQLRFFGQREKIWAKPVLIDVSMFI